MVKRPASALDNPVRDSPSSTASQRAKAIVNTPANGVSAGEVQLCHAAVVKLVTDCLFAASYMRCFFCGLLSLSFHCSLVSAFQILHLYRWCVVRYSFISRLLYACYFRRINSENIAAKIQSCCSPLLGDRVN